jgi:SET domain-containing protein
MMGSALGNKRENMVSSWISPKARKGISSGIAGRGLFATERIGADEIVAVKGGRIVTTSQLRELPEPLPNSEIQIADGLHLVAILPEEYEPVMLFINHSREPNVGFAGNIVLVAMRDVTAGEELTADYALFDDYDGHMACHCNTASCRRVIGRPRLAATRPSAQVPRIFLVVPRT